MSVVFDAVGPSSAGQTASSVSSMSWTHTPVGVPTAVSVQVALVSTPFTGSVTVTYGGVSMTNAVDKTNPTITRAIIFGLASPPSGPQTVVVTFGSAIDKAAGGSITVTGSDPVACFDFVSAGATGRSNHPLDNPCSSAVGDLVIDCGAQRVISGSWTPNAGQTQAWMNINGTSSYAPGAASVTMIENTGTSDFWSIVSASFKAAPSAPVAHQLMGQIIM